MANAQMPVAAAALLAIRIDVFRIVRQLQLSIRLAQDEAECDAWAGYAQFTNGLHAVTFFAAQPR
jgi:hypothetical protein